MNYKMKKMYGGTKKKMQAGGVDKTSERFKNALANTKSRNERQQEKKRLSAVKKSGMDVSYADRTQMQKGGAKPDYLDMDGDGNKKESMKSAVASKKKMQMGGMGKGKASKRTSDKLTKDKLTKNFGKAKTPGKVTGKAANNKGKKMKMGGKKKMGMGGNKMMKYQAGGFLEPPVYDLDA